MSARGVVERVGTVATTTHNPSVQSKLYATPLRTASAASSSNTTTVPSRLPTNRVPVHSRCSSFRSGMGTSSLGREAPRYVSALLKPGAPLSGL